MNDLDEPAKLMRFVLDMRTAGVTDPKTLAALERTPRAHFAPEHLVGLALDDVALPLACGQTMTKPSVVGRMVASLDLAPEHSVLEVGAGSGFQAGVIAQIAKRVVTLDRYRTLAAEARGKLGVLRLMHVSAHQADGRLGWPEFAPYDRIVVNAADAVAPLALLDQLAEGGVLLMPIGEIGQVRLMRFRKGAGAPDDLGPIDFAPLEDGVAQEL